MTCLGPLMHPRHGQTERDKTQIYPVAALPLTHKMAVTEPSFKILENAGKLAQPCIALIALALAPLFSAPRSE